MSRSFLGRRSVFSRWNKRRYKRGKIDGNLNKQHFLMIWSSLVVSWFFFGLWPEEDLDSTMGRILNKKHFCQYSFICRSCQPCTALSYNTKTNAISLKKWRIVGIYQKSELLQTLQHTFHYDLDASHTIGSLWDNNRAF